ncbi:MAG: response regulator transcription factor [Gammaproteobacteria bacterium]|nr:MAG: response regulator transcription factor [Gammaproteobacteria bacterium]
MRLLIIEDDDALRRSLAANLRENGFTVDEAANAAEGEYYAAEFASALAIIDLGLPDRPGAELIADFRNRGMTFPILILTARDHWQDKVDGLNAGADDYVVKPFNLDELLARINALLRRAAGHARSVIRHGRIELDTQAQEISVDGRAVQLTAFEYRLIEILLMRVGQVVTKANLTDQLYDQDFERDSNVIEVLITRLRNKLDPDRSLGLIETLRGRGYRIARLEPPD